MTLTNTDVFIRLLLAFILGGLVGLERQTRGKNAGIKTHILVSLGACLVMLNGIHLSHGTGSDPSRMASQVISGIGFLGSGLILKDANLVKGLTSASSVWLVACIGISVGSGFFIGGVVTTGIIISLLLISRTRLYRRVFEEKFYYLQEHLDDDIEEFTD